NGGGVDQPDGAYTYLLESAAGGDVASPATGRLSINRSLGLAVTGFAIDNPFFSPNGDGVQDTATVSASANYTVNWTTLVKDAGGATVRTLTGTGTQVIATWDGRNDGGTLQPEAAYTLFTTVTAGTATVTDIRMTTLDVTAPIAM